MPDQYQLPCCYPDGSCEEFVGYDPGLLEQQCADAGGCQGIFNGSCEDGCNGVPVSCCDLTDGTCHCEHLWDTCLSQLDGIILCPACGDDECSEAQQIACDDMANGLHVCCYDDYTATGLCQVMTYAECAELGGRFLWEQDECNEYVCGVGCREAVYAEDHPTEGPYFDGPEWGQKRHTTDTCYPVAMVGTIPPPEHNSGIPGRCMGFVTAHEVRNVAQAGEDDPCALAYGVLGYDHAGIIRPYLCSQVQYEDDVRGRTEPPKSAAYSEGFFCKSVPDENGECPVIPCGCFYARVNVMAEPPREVRYNHPKLICGGVD